jgi:hypothetical protein
MALYSSRPLGFLNRDTRYWSFALISPLTRHVSMWLNEFNVLIFYLHRVRAVEGLYRQISIPRLRCLYLLPECDPFLVWQIFTKRKQLGIALTKMYWLLGRKSKLSINNKLLIYKTILKPIWAYGIHLWGTASTSNIEILERFQSKALRMITDAPWYVLYTVIRKDL